MTRLIAFFLAAIAVGCAAPAETESSAASSAASTDDLQSAKSGDTHSSLTPMGIHFERFVGQSLSADDRAFFADASRQPSVPPSVSSLSFWPFTVNLYPNGDPVPADVNQHAIGDCSAASVWASLSMQAPAFVKGLIDDHGDGTFGVHVHDPAGRPFVINLDSKFLGSGSNDLEAVSAKDHRANWVTVLEKAAMKYLEIYPIVGRIGGIGSEFASPIFTGSGESYAFEPGRLTPAQFTRAVESELAAGKIIIGGFNRVAAIGSVQTVTAHAYMILGPETPSAMVSMRNPWGVSPEIGGTYDASNDGIVDVPATTAWAQTVDLRVIDPGAARP